MGSSVKKGAYVEESLTRRFDKVVLKVVSASQSKPGLAVPRLFQLRRLYVCRHDGRKHMPVFVTENMVGMKFGDFVATRTFKAHGGVKAKKAMQKK